MKNGETLAKRREALRRFYALLDQLENRIGGFRELRDCSGESGWPRRGVYFFHEKGEYRTDSGTGPRIVRVGTHALKEGSGTTLWDRLSTHKGTTSSGGGNHRGSIFRLIVGVALIKRSGHTENSWGRGKTASPDISKNELSLERKVSEVIRNMPFIWLPIEDNPGPSSLRGYIERNSISLLSNYRKEPVDSPSEDWLGRNCDRPKVVSSGLWNQKHVEETADLAFLYKLEALIKGAAL